MQSCYKERIFYYWKHCLYGHVRIICEQEIEKKKNDICLIIYQSLSQAILGDTEQSLATLNTIQYRTDLKFLLLVSTYFIHKTSKNPKISQITEIKDQIESNNGKLPIFVFEFSSEIAFLFGDYDLSEKIINKTNRTIQMNSILGWIKLKRGQFHESEVIFDEILKNPNNSFHLLTLYGKGKLLFQKDQYSEAIQFYARILSKFEFPEINFEKALIYMVKGNWNFLNDLVCEVTDSLPTTIEIDIFNFLNSFYFSENVNKAIESLKSIVQICMKYESKNWFLIARLSHAFGTIGCRNDEILFQSMKLAQLAVNAKNNSSYCLSVLGYHQIMNGRIIIGQNSLYESIKYDQSNNFAQENIMRMNFECGNLNTLKDELDLYNSLNEKNTFVLLFISKVSRLLHKENYKAFFELIEKVNLNILAIFKGPKIDNNYRYSEIMNDFFSNVELPFMKFIELSINLNLEIIFDTFDEILYYYEFPKTSLNTNINSTINNILKNLSNLIPNSTPIQYYKGCFLYFQKKYFESLITFQSILISPFPYKISKSLMMIASIYDIKEDKETASQYLNEALKYDKMIRNEIFFKFLNLKINPTQTKMKKYFDFIIKSFDKQSFLYLISFVDLFIQLKDYQKSLNILKLMVKRFDSKIEKGLIIIRQAKIFAGRDNDINQAKFLLNRLENHHKIRESSIIAEAEIYLNIFHNDQKYIQILKEYTEKVRSQKKYEILGDGYSRLRMFTEASECYIKSIFGQKGFNEENSINYDSECIQKLLTSLIKCHRYNDAVLTFTNCILYIKSNKKAIIMSLLSQIVNIEKLEEVKRCIDNISSLYAQNSMDNWSLIDAEFLAVKAFFLKKSGDLHEASESYEKSITIYEKILNSKKANVYINTKKRDASEICVEAGGFFESFQRKEKAVELYKKAYSFSPTNQTALLRLVNHYEQRQEMNKCVELLQDFIEKDPYNEMAVLLVTSFRRQDLNKSITVLKNFLTKKPNFHRVIVRLIEICARSGRRNLNKAKDFLSSDRQPGMVFSKAVFDLHKGQIQKSLKGFELVMNDRKWGAPAKHCMIEIILNPKRKYIWEVNEPLTTSENLKKAQELIDQIYPQNSDENDDQIEREIILAELEKSANTDQSIASATDRYQAVINRLKTATLQPLPSTTSPSSHASIAAVVGLASCHLRMNRQKEAVYLIDQLIKPNPLQIQNGVINNDVDFSYISSSSPTHETSPYFEEAYLIRATVLLNGSATGSQQAALHYAYLALDLNQSCRKGWEICADAYSKSSMFDDAANALKNCWILSRGDLKVGDSDWEKVAEIGFLFADASLKAKKPEDALEMCRELLDIDPCFSDLKEKIIIPAFKMLKQ